MRKFLLGLVIGLSFLGLSVYALSTFLVTQGGTGASSFSPNSLIVSGSTATGALIASSSPTVNYIYASTTNATSTFKGGINAGIVAIGTTTPMSGGGLIVSGNEQHWGGYAHFGNSTSNFPCNSIGAICRSFRKF